MEDELPLLPGLRRHLPPRRGNQPKTLTLRVLPRQAAPDEFERDGTTRAVSGGEQNIRCPPGRRARDARLLDHGTVVASADASPSPGRPSKLLAVRVPATGTTTHCVRR